MAMFFLMMLHLYTVITHFYPEGLPVNAQEFCRFINLKVKVVECLFYVFLFHVYQSHPAGRRIHDRRLCLIYLAIVKYIRQINDRMVAHNTQALDDVLKLPD